MVKCTKNMFVYKKEQLCLFNKSVQLDANQKPCSKVAFQYGNMFILCAILTNPRIIHFTNGEMYQNNLILNKHMLMNNNL